jgi:response regulator RpfG family c-di-GMP phosphodiesterase
MKDEKPMQTTRAATKVKPRVLCVDDERNVLEGLATNIGRRYDVETATSGAQALELLAGDPKRAVIISDMRMPIMDGATFLAKARELAPQAVRILLTGQTDLDSAISAVNDGQIFRFLTKPCAPPTLLAAIAAAVQQHELITAERVLLEQTLHGCIKALTDVLALTNPAAFGRATRIKQLVGELARKLNLSERWQAEIAAMLSQLGHITLPAETAEKLYFGQPLNAEEQQLVDKLPALTEQLLGNIPRLEAVREMLAGYPKPFPSAAARPEDLNRDVIYTGTQLLKLAVEFDALESHPSWARYALDKLNARREHYDPRILAALVELRVKANASAEAVRKVSINELVVGMVLAADIKLPNGMLLAARGHEITIRFLERIRTFPLGALKDGLLVTSPMQGVPRVTLSG